MKSRWKRSTAALALVAFGAGGAPVFAQQATPATGADKGIPDIVVTATRREESLNRVPIAIQALSGASLEKLNVTNFEKLIEFLPNVRSASHGPGTSSIFIRGLSTDSPGLQIQGTAGTSPFGALGYNPEGVRVGQDASRHQRAVKVWERRDFRDYDDGAELGPRAMRMALRC